jgi:hypothetical protein
LRAVTAELVESRIEIDAVAAEPALCKDRGDARRLLGGSKTLGVHDHARKPRR